jgi:hypothetical protein
LAIPVFGVHDALSAMIMHDVATMAAATKHEAIPSSQLALFVSGFWVLGCGTQASMESWEHQVRN